MIRNHGTCTHGLHLKGVLLQQRKDSIRRLNGRIVDDEILNLVLCNKSAARIKLIVRNAINMEWTSQQDLGNKNGVPGDANRAATLVVDHAELYGRAEPKVDERFEKGKRALVLIQTAKLYPRRIFQGNVFVIYRKVWIVKETIAQVM